jgi:hypothetical protein
MKYNTFSVIYLICSTFVNTKLQHRHKSVYLLRNVKEFVITCIGVYTVWNFCVSPTLYVGARGGVVVKAVS